MPGPLTLLLSANRKPPLLCGFIYAVPQAFFFACWTTCTSAVASWDTSEARSNSFSRRDERLLRQIQLPLRIEAHLAAEDPRRLDLEHRALSKLRRALGLRATPQRGDLHFVMITRQGCHLCEQAWELLERFQKKHGIALQQVDVDTDPNLVAKHGNCVPVVLVNGEVRFRGRVNEVLLTRIIDRPLGDSKTTR